jgi:spermidine synthase
MVKEVTAILLLIGFAAMTAQVVLMRELMVVCSGNEISLGLMLACWLLWTAVGSAAAPRRHDARRQLAWLNAASALLLPATLPLLRVARILLGATPGEALGPGAVLGISFLALAPLCLASGATFATASRLRQSESGVYLYETLGAVAAAAATTAAFLAPVSGFLMAAVAAWMNLAAALYLWRGRNAALGALVALPVALIGGDALDTSTRRLLWTGFEVKAWRDSRYGNLTLTHTPGMSTLYQSGLAALHLPNAAEAEEAVHYALLEHENPRRMLLIGGGLNGSLNEALRHPMLEHADYVELDPELLGLVREQFPEEWNLLASNPRIGIHPDDGRRFLERAGAPYDVIIVNLADPQTAQLNRFYTLEFFRLARRKLAPGGVLALQLAVPENYISQEQAELVRTIRNTLLQVFPAVAALPATPVHLLAATPPAALTTDGELLIRRLKARQLDTQYVREYFIPFRINPERVHELETRTRPNPLTATNRDFHPVAYFLYSALWGARYSPIYREAFQILSRFPAWGAVVFILAAFALGAALTSPRMSAVAASGFTGMGIEILLLFGFQALYGCVYLELAPIAAGFMAGLAVGAWLVLKWRRALPLEVLAAVGVVAAAVLYRLMPLTPEWLFAGLSLAGGMLGGALFAVAGREAATPGRLYAADLAGACLGALVFSAWLVPAFGFGTAAVAMGAANLPAAIALVWNRRKPAR